MPCFRNFLGDSWTNVRMQDLTTCRLKDAATQKQLAEMTWFLAALGALLAAAAIAASMRWSPYP
jgi:hypothetical protein